MDKVQKPISSQCYIPSSEPFRINLYFHALSVPLQGITVLFLHEAQRVNVGIAVIIFP
jgi:hypothetical protein